MHFVKCKPFALLYSTIVSLGMVSGTVLRLIALASFSIYKCFNSDPKEALKKNANGLPFWFKMVAKAMSEESVSNLNCWDSLLEITTIFF